ncbi:MAG: hypothetical protein AB1656_07160 [Candidatus Omnitrophota bacterium]
MTKDFVLSYLSRFIGAKNFLLREGFVSLLLTAFLLVAAGDSPGAEEQAPLGAPALLFPANGSKMLFPGTYTLIPFAWSAVNDATAYEINVIVRISSKEFRPAAQTVTPATSVSLNLNLTVRESQAQVQWTVRALNEYGAGILSEMSAFTFGLDSGTPIPDLTPLPTPPPTATPTPPMPPRLLYPEDGAQIDALTALQGVTFSWEPVVGAYTYQLTVYEDNQPFFQQPLKSMQHSVIISQPIQKAYQWDIRSINSANTIGKSSGRRSFRVGEGIYPTPTPYPVSVDINHNGKLDAEDLYRFAANYGANDPKTDFDHTGLNDANDLILFIDLYQAARR